MSESTKKVPQIEKKKKRILAHNQPRPTLTEMANDLNRAAVAIWRRAARARRAVRRRRKFTMSVTNESQKNKATQRDERQKANDELCNFQRFRFNWIDFYFDWTVCAHYAKSSTTDNRLDASCIQTSGERWLRIDSAIKVKKFSDRKKKNRESCETAGEHKKGAKKESKAEQRKTTGERERVKSTFNLKSKS